MDKGLNRTTTPSNAEKRAVVDVAIAIVVDKLSDQRDTHAGPDADSSEPASDRAGITILISRRRAEQVLGGLWELPGGKIEPNETASQAVVRELCEEVGIDVLPIDTLPTAEHHYEHAHVRLHPFICRVIAGSPSPIEVDEVRWVRPDDLADYPMPQASQPVLTAFRHWLNTPDRTRANGPEDDPARDHPRP